MTAMHEKMHSDAGKKQNGEKEIAARQMRTMFVEH